MNLKPIRRASLGLRIGLLIACILSLAFGVMIWFQVGAERRIDHEDLNRRSHVLAHQMSSSTIESLALSDAEFRKARIQDLNGHSRLLGFAVYRPDGRLVAAGKGVADFGDEMRSPVKHAFQSDREVVEIIQVPDSQIHILAFPLRDTDGTVKGTLVVVHDASHLKERDEQRLLRFSLWVLLMMFLVVALVVGSTWLAYDRPLGKLAHWMEKVRTGNADDEPPAGLPVSLLATESHRLAASFRAARAANREESSAVVREHNFWNRDRLRLHAQACLGNEAFVVVSNREPYMHQFQDGQPRLIVPAGGVVTALDPVLQACGGVWVAHGAGEADRQTADSHGRLRVPPSNPSYTLKRVWLSREEEQGYYYGLANEGLWPLCHIAHERPTFRESDWKHYVEVNRRFADAALEETGTSDAIVLVQDYQLALVPRMLRESRPNLRIGIFWHIPWPNPETFRICPWRVEILRGILGADLIGFHLQQYCNNFLDTVDRMVEARLDWDHFAVEFKRRQSLVRPFPISVESWAERDVQTGDDLERQIAQLKEKHKLGNSQIVIGVERIDYTKGLPERFRAAARFFEKFPQHRGKYTFVVLGAPSRTHIRRYRDLITELESLADEINWKYQTDGWKPLHFLATHHDPSTVYAFMRMASICVVSSLHDGMNLVAKEYVAAKADNDGVLILSEFAGAARELPDALIINPYDTERFADVICTAVEMAPAERASRMERMRNVVGEHNVYRWAGTLLGDLAAIRTPKAAVRETALALGPR